MDDFSSPLGQTSRAPPRGVFRRIDKNRDHRINVAAGPELGSWSRRPNFDSGISATRMRVGTRIWHSLFRTSVQTSPCSCSGSARLVLSPHTHTIAALLPPKRRCRRYTRFQRGGSLPACADHDDQIESRRMASGQWMRLGVGDSSTPCTGVRTSLKRAIRLLDRNLNPSHDRVQWKRVAANLVAKSF